MGQSEHAKKDSLWGAKETGMQTCLDSSVVF
jgi:hypothetical protein